MHHAVKVYQLQLYEPHCRLTRAQSGAGQEREGWCRWNPRFSLSRGVELGVVFAGGHSPLSWPGTLLFSSAHLQSKHGACKS
jgi:hypothetical protein